MTERLHHQRTRTDPDGGLTDLSAPVESEFSDVVPTRGYAPARGRRHGRSSAGGKVRDLPWHAARALGALAVLATGAVHLQQFLRLYSQIPTIGTLFVLNFAGATVVGLALLAPVEHASHRYGTALVGLLSLAGIAIATGAFVFLQISERTPLFGFMEPGYDPAAIAAAQAAEITAVLALSASLMGRVWCKAPTTRW